MDEQTASSIEPYSDEIIALLNQHISRHPDLRVLEVAWRIGFATLLAEIVRGSLLDRKIFHRRGCAKCRRGEGHRVWVLTVGYPGGRVRQFSIRPEQKPQVERWVRNYQKLRAKLEAICELNHELLRAEP